MTAVLFCHGLESGPVGRKSKALRSAGFQVVAPDLRGMVLRRRLERFEPILAETGAPVVVGSSYGGLVALLALLRVEKQERPQLPRGLVLCAPALHLKEPPADRVVLKPPRTPTTVIHGVGDTVIPIDVSRQFASMGDIELIEVDDDHRLAESVDVIIGAVVRLLTA